MTFDGEKNANCASCLGTGWVKLDHGNGTITHTQCKCTVSFSIQNQRTQMTFDERNAMTCLEDLKFKAEEVEQYCADLLGRELAEELNRILREKLERAPEVHFCIDMVYPELQTGIWHLTSDLTIGGRTHKARLVCIKPIKE